MKINTPTMAIIIAALFLWIFLQNGCHRELFDSDEVTSVDTTEVITPPITGDIENPIQYIRDTVEVIKYVPVSSKKNKELLEKYKKENDSLKEVLYREAVAINTYQETFEDTNVKIEAFVQTYGKLDKLSISSYELKPQTVKVPCDCPVQKKKYRLSLGTEVGIPTRLGNPVIFKGGLTLQNKNNMRYKLGYDTESNIWAGVDIIIF